MQDSTQTQLRQFIEQLERLEEDRLATVADFKDKMAELKAVGFDPKIVRKVLALRKKGKHERDEEDALLATYCHALGMQGSFEFEAGHQDMQEAHA